MTVSGGGGVSPAKYSLVWQKSLTANLETYNSHSAI